jgi:large subunit ribosomal protein L1
VHRLRERGIQYFSVPIALRLIRACWNSSYVEAVEAIFIMNLDPRKPGQTFRSNVTLPHGIGKQVRVAVFAKGQKADEARAAGADVVGDADLAELIQKEGANFDRVIATPDVMATIGRLGRILGPRGLMPNPKLGTVTNDVTKAIRDAKAGQLTMRSDKAGVIRCGFGKVNFDDEKLIANLAGIYENIVANKPSGARGSIYVKHVWLKGTNGPAVPIDLSYPPFNIGGAAAANTKGPTVKGGATSASAAVITSATATA